MLQDGDIVILNSGQRHSGSLVVDRGSGVTPRRGGPEATVNGCLAHILLAVYLTGKRTPGLLQEIATRDSVPRRPVDAVAREV